MVNSATLGSDERSNATNIAIHFNGKLAPAGSPTHPKRIGGGTGRAEGALAPPMYRRQYRFCPCLVSKSLNFPYTTTHPHCANGVHAKLINIYEQCFAARGPSPPNIQLLPPPVPKRDVTYKTNIPYILSRYWERSIISEARSYNPSVTKLASALRTLLPPPQLSGA